MNIEYKQSSLNVSDVIYKIDIAKNKKKRILKHVSFKLFSNEMCALMGASGSGKT